MSSQRKLTDNQNNPKILKPFSFDWPKRATWFLIPTWKTKIHLCQTIEVLFY
jgi:hypothetical protein